MLVQGKPEHSMPYRRGWNQLPFGMPSLFAIVGLAIGGLVYLALPIRPRPEPWSLPTFYWQVALLQRLTHCLFWGGCAGLLIGLFLDFVREPPKNIRFSVIQMLAVVYAAGVATFTLLTCVRIVTLPR